MVVVIHALVKSRLDLFTAGENFPVQKLVSELDKEALDSAVHPGTLRSETYIDSNEATNYAEAVLAGSSA